MRNPKNFVAVLPERASVVVAGARSNLPHARQCPAIVETLEGRQLLSAGAIDPTFGSGGTAQLSSKTSIGAGIVCDLPNNNLLVVGDSIATNGRAHGVFVARYNSKGRLDDQFGKNGKAAFSPGDFSVIRAAIEPGGRIILLLVPQSGSSGVPLPGSANVLIGLTWRGNLDAKFGHHGRLKLNGSVDHYVMASTPSGKILLAGVPRSSSGTFNVGQPLRFVDGTATVIEQLKPGGRPDPAFGNHGSIVTALDVPLNWPTFLAAQHDGKIIVGVSTQVPGPTILLGTDVWINGVDTRETPTVIPGVSIARYTQQGQLDTTFGTNGIISNSAVNGSIALTAEDQIVAAYVYVPPPSNLIMIFADPGSGLYRYTPDGQIDTPFAEDGSLHVFGTVPIPLPDGKILIESNSQGFVSLTSSPVSFHRLDQTGGVDTGFGVNLSVGLGSSAVFAVEQHRVVFVSDSILPAPSPSSGKHVVTLTAFQI